MTRSEYHATGKEDPSRSEKKEKNRNSVSVSIHTVDGEEGTSSEIDHHHQHRHQHPRPNIVENNLEPRANATPSPSALSSSSGAVAAAAAARRISVIDADSIVLSRLHPRSKTRGSASRGSRSSSWSFWLSFLAINISIFISAMSFMAIGTVLPTVANALGDRRGDFTWIGSAYALSMTCFIPLSGTMSDIFGRKPTLLLCIICFALGSALAGASQNMTMMISAQAIQGIGGGGMISITEMIISDLVSPSDQRSKYQGVLGLTWSLASAVAPIIGGAFASNSHITWRWLFYLNLPLTGVAGGLIAVFLDVPHPKGSALQKLVRVDWIGNAIIIFGCGLTTIGLAWGGVRFPWSSAQVLVPLILGFTLLLAFGVYETRISKRPLVKLDVFYENRTALSGLLGTAAHGIASTAFIFFMPVYFQAVLGHSPVHSAIDFLSGVLVIVTAAFTAGIVVTYTGLYRPIIYIGWGLMMIGFGLLSMLKEGNEVGKWVGYQVVVGAGAGLLFSTPNSSIAASLSPNQAASALSFSNFVRAFAQTWGITIASTILQNLLKHFLPTSTSFPGDSDIAFAAIPAISSLPEGLKTEVRHAFARSIAVIWQTMIGICGLGLLGSFLMKEVKTSSRCCSKRKASTAYVLKEGLSDDLTFTSNGLRNGSTFEDESGRRDRRNRDVEAGGIAMEVRENVRRHEELEMQRTDT
ncbi:MFS general substrate transporter [Dendrothele bispora CBS 962.96]|uniref:MFS general substrate transporter n=1 Tax=Dendrothele bispora (strain CBS 962.96) TaxID=1314807 RepID=A0A4S8L8E1_DENBC|nr:MFS general substrate transporter [Dendrothele bispora CBS 962.96]